MKQLITLSLLAFAMVLIAGIAFTAEVTVKLSGPGAINDSTIKSGEQFALELWWNNDKDERRGFATGFKLFSNDIKKVIHVKDTLPGLNDDGDLKGYNGWQNSEIWDFTGVIIRKNQWNGILPDTVGMAGIVVKKRFNKCKPTKAISMNLIVKETGTLSIDSTFYPPGGKWEMVNGDGSVFKPDWGGPYHFKVVK